MKKKIKEVIRALKKCRTIHYKNGFIRVGDNGFWQPRSHPKKSLLTAARRFGELNGKHIIEIGSGIQGDMTGNSILVWCSKTKAEKIIALDLDEKQIEDVKKATRQFPNVEALVMDGIEYLKNFRYKIDLLYLDFWTPDPEGSVPGTGRANAHLAAYNAAKDKLNQHSLIHIDDTDHIAPYKHTAIIPAARKDGFVVVYTGRQTLLER